MSHSDFPVYARRDLEIVGGVGVHAETATGETLLDLYGGHAALALGLRHPAILKALRIQAETVFFQTNLVECEVRRKAEADLARFAPDGLNRVFLVNSGAEANENALRLAMGNDRGTRVIAVKGGFHGRTAAAAACTSGALDSWYGFPRTPFDVTHVAPNDIAELEGAMGDDVAAFIFEAVQGVGGAVFLDSDYLGAARKLSDSCGALMIADEVQCGIGRSGRAFAVEWSGVKPDIITSAKALACGFPAGAVIATSELADSLKKGDLGTTFGGGPMASALISAVLSEITKLMPRIAALEEQIRETCCIGPVVSIQGKGLLLGFRLSRPAGEVINELLQRGILVGGSALPDVMRIMPPLILEAEHIEQLATALGEIRS